MAGYINEPNYCGDCALFESELACFGSCSKERQETWHGEIACEDFPKKEDEGDE
ncbi:MAG: hypothetical protein IJ349_05430 [Clostridia bacterium]|nr:hypothetical protein [Clostridia bacterium]